MMVPMMSRAFISILMEVSSTLMATSSIARATMSWEVITMTKISIILQRRKAKNISINSMISLMVPSLLVRQNHIAIARHIVTKNGPLMEIRLSGGLWQEETQQVSESRVISGRSTRARVINITSEMNMATMAKSLIIKMTFRATMEAEAGIRDTIQV